MAGVKYLISGRLRDVSHRYLMATVRDLWAVYLWLVTGIFFHMYAMSNFLNRTGSETRYCCGTTTHWIWDYNDMVCVKSKWFQREFLVHMAVIQLMCPALCLRIRKNTEKRVKPNLLRHEVPPKGFFFLCWSNTNETLRSSLYQWIKIVASKFLPLLLSCCMCTQRAGHKSVDLALYTLFHVKWTFFPILQRQQTNSQKEYLSSLFYFSLEKKQHAL